MDAIAKQLQNTRMKSMAALLFVACFVSTGCVVGLLTGPRYRWWAQPFDGGYHVLVAFPMATSEVSTADWEQRASRQAEMVVRHEFARHGIRFDESWVLPNPDMEEGGGVWVAVWVGDHSFIAKWKSLGVRALTEAWIAETKNHGTMFESPLKGSGQIEEVGDRRYQKDT